MTKTPLIAFRCRPEALRAALEADAAKSGQSVTELVLRALCRKYRCQDTPTQRNAENGRTLFAACPDCYDSRNSGQCLGNLDGNQRGCKLTDETKTNSPWAFRFHPTLRRAIERDMKRTGMDRTEAVSRKLCEAYAIEYRPATVGRPVAKKATRKRVKE